MRTEAPSYELTTPNHQAAQERYSETFGVTQTLERDIIEFLSSKYTDGATITVQEVMDLYHCPADRARRVIANLITDEVLERVTSEIYRVTI